jgi:hypothetical protein
LPAAHATHEVFPATLYCPPGHTPHVGPGGAAPNFPGGHLAHSASDSACGGPKRPAGHAPHSSSAGAAPNWPPGHVTQAVCPTCANVPSSQGRQAVALASVLYLPTVQLRQPYSTVHVQV